MDSEQQSALMKFEAPGPGSWSVDSVHFPRPLSRFHAEIFPSNLAEGFRDCARRYGLLIDTLDFRVVNGFAYFAAVPAPEADIPTRFEAATEVFEHKIWRDDLTRWENDVKPTAMRTHEALLAIEPDALSEDDLIKYLDRCRDHLQAMVRQHHTFNAPALIPVGDFVAHIGEWTGLPLGEFLALARGAAPESAGSFAELDRLTSALRSDPAARQVLDSNAENATILERLRSHPGEVGAAAKAYLGIVGHRLLDSLDTGEPAAIEVPEVLIQGIRAALSKGASPPSEASADEVSRLRNLVPEAHREMYDELLAETRLMSSLRDERGLYSDVWAAGIMRRALLAAGSRLVAKGRLEQPAHLIEGDYQEILTLISGAEGPAASELAERAKYRSVSRVGNVPAFLGDPPSAPPPLDGLPPHVARVMGAMGAAVGALFGDPTSNIEPSIVRGTGASPGTYTGTARVIDGPVEFGRLRPGDVLVTATTTESFNIVIPLLGAIITNSGGVLSHAAIVGREYGIPSVVGTRDATKRIPDGAQVHVDGTTGLVRFDAP